MNYSSELYHNVVHTSQSIKRSTKHADEISDNSKVIIAGCATKLLNCIYKMFLT